jgi:hypothetical protein
MLQWLDSLTVCDPACGSGAILTVVFQWFEQVRLDLLTDLQHAEPEAPECHDERGQPGDVHDWIALSAPRILRNNIFGVDLSPESVEIAQLSLWIRTARRGQPLTDLSANILCGNSVVDDPEVDPAHAFNWSEKFPKVFAQGGFDAVVGNPPYVRQERLAPYKEHLSQRYKAYSGTADLYVYFYEKGIEILKPDGRLAFISSGTFVKGAFAAPLRRLLSSDVSLDSLIDFGEFQPFPEAEMVRPSCVTLIKGNSISDTRVLKFLGKETPPRDLAEAIREFGINMATPKGTDGEWQLEVAETVDLLRKLQSTGSPLKSYSDGALFRGVVTGLNEVFVIPTELKERLISEDRSSEEIIHPFLQGTHLRPWYQEISGEWIIFTRRGMDLEEYPAIKTYLESHRRSLEPRPEEWSPTKETPAWPGRKPGGYRWFEIQDATDYAPSFQSSKIVWPDIAKLPRCSMDDGRHFLGNTAYMVALEDYYLLGVLNSWTSWFVISRTAQPLRLRAGRWQYRCIRQFMELLPIPTPPAKAREPIADLAKQISGWARERYELTEKVCRRFDNTFGGLIDAKLSEKLHDWPSLSFTQLGVELKKSFKLPKSPWEDPRTADTWEPFWKTEHARHVSLSRSIADAEAEINQRVYRLFDLSPEEIALLEQSVAS